MQPLDPESKLAGDTIGHIRRHLVERKIMRCCANPQLAPVDSMYSWLSVKRDGESMSTDLSSGMPVIAVACTSCGQVRTFMAQFVLPDWEGKHLQKD